MYLVSVYFDEKSSRVISRYIEKIADKTGNTFMTDNHVPPHLTIASVETKDETGLMEKMNVLKERLRKGKIQLVSVGALFPYVLYITPVLNQYLEQMAEEVHKQLTELTDIKLSRYYQPMQWLPHLTVGKKLTKEQMREAFSLMQEHFVQMEVSVTEIGLAKTNPHKDIVRIELNE